MKAPLLEFLQPYEKKLTLADMKVYEDILKALDHELELLEIEQEDVMSKAERGIKIARVCIENLRETVMTKSFTSLEYEKYFFKEVKPRIFSKLIYYVKLFTIESKRPRSSHKAQKRYLIEQIDKLQDYFNDNLEFYHYYRRGATTLDDQFFLRGKADIRLHPDTFHFFTDQQFSTSHDSSVAMIIAYDMLIVHLNKEIERLNSNQLVSGRVQLKKPIPKLFWTANKVDLIELIYALQTSGAINSGTADIKDIALTLETILDMDLGDYYRTYLEIRSRKIQRTKFLDSLKEQIIRRMNEADN